MTAKKSTATKSAAAKQKRALKAAPPPPPAPDEQDPAVNAIVQAEQELLQQTLRDAQTQHLLNRCINLSIEVQRLQAALAEAQADAPAEEV